MPCLTLKLAGEPSATTCADIARTLTDLTAELLEKKRELTAVLVETLPARQWFINAGSLESSSKNSFCLDIAITSGTNTKQQKAAYIRSVFLAMTELLGELDQASYIMIREIAADAWGYQGMTQEYRFVATQSL